MATLRDFVSEKILKFPNQGGYWTKCELSDSGYQGDRGVELGDTFFNFEKHFQYNGTELTYKLEQTWSKINNFPDPVPQEYYPIISIFLDVDNQSVPGCENVNGYNQWWDYTIKRVPQEGGGYVEVRDDFITGGFANYKLDTKISGDLAVTGYSANEYEFSQYYDSENNYVTEGFDVVARPSYAPMYDMYWYKEGAYANVLYFRSWSQPQYITGNPAYGDYTLQFANPFDCNNQQAYTEQTPMLLSLDTNVPIIVWDAGYYSTHTYDIANLMKNYKEDGDLTRFHTYIADGHAVLCNGYVAPSVIDGTKSFQCYSDIFTGYWDEDSVEEETRGSQSDPDDKYRYLQVWVAPTTTYPTPRVSLYKANYGNELRCNIKVYGDLRQYKYSVDGGNSWTTVEKEGQEPIELPWTFMYYKRTNEKGWLSYDKNHGGNMLLFASEALCDDGSPFLAEDYGDKSFYYGATNETGTVETSTEMATTYMASGFQRIYICDRNDIRAISQQLYDTQSGGIWEDIKKGVEMYGENPINAVAGLTFFPFDLTTCFRNWGTAGSIWFGGYELQNVTVKELSNFNGYIDIGSIQILESFPNGDYRNYEPYCSLAIYLPFIGLQELKMNKYVGKTLSIRYYVDVLTGGCIACLFADGVLVDYFNGSMGVQLPISLTDYASFTSSQIQNLTELGSAITGAPAKVVSGMATGGPAGAVAGGFDAMADFEKSMFNLSSNAMDNFNTTKGASTSMINQYLPNYVYVIFSIIETEETSNLMTLEGRRTNASGTVGSFSGFLQVESVNLKASGATESEKQAIKGLLASGIYI